ncbi:MAG TPA: aminotransferase class I/II-fold pyridoxal phosphate-dependent enzyme [Xanthobacteraceae bacterium]
MGTFTASARAKQLVMEVLNSNRLSYGPMMQRFETEFARLHGSRFGIMSNSGTSALQLALQAMKELHGWADGDEVIVPSLTFVATPNIVLHNRMTPVLADVDPRFYEIDPQAIERAITPRTRAVIPVHLFGQPADMDPIAEIAKQHALKVIEDSAETMFASYKGRRVGGLGDVGCFSTYVAHLLVTGVGGINCTDNPEYAVKIRSLLNHGRDSIYLSIDDDKDRSSEDLQMVVERRFNFTSIGHSFRVTEMEAALGLAQLEDWRPGIEQRRRNAAFLTQALSKFDNHFQTPDIRPECEHSFMMFPIVLRNEDKRRLVNFLEENGIETRDMLPLTNQPVYHRLLNWREDDYPVAKWINSNGFYIGCHQDLTDIDLEYVVEYFDRFFRGGGSQRPEAIALVLLVDRDATMDSAGLAELPAELFAKTVAVDCGMTPAVRMEIERSGFPIMDGGTKGALAAVTGAPEEVMPDCVVMYPFNGQWNSKDIPRMVMMLTRGYDLVIASRFMMGGKRKGGGGTVSSLGNRVFNLAANVAFGSNLTDGFSSFRAFRRSKLAEVHRSGSGLAKMFAQSLDAVRLSLRIQEIPTVESVKSTRQVVDDSVSSAFPALLVLLREWWSQVRYGSDKQQ